MGERFLAFLCDLLVEWVFIGLFLLMMYSKSSLSLETLEQNALWIVPTAYMTLAEWLFHSTVGKRLLRIQLRAD